MPGTTLMAAVVTGGYIASPKLVTDSGRNVLCQGAKGFSLCVYQGGPVVGSRPIAEPFPDQGVTENRTSVARLDTPHHVELYPLSRNNFQVLHIDHHPEIGIELRGINAQRNDAAGIEHGAQIASQQTRHLATQGLGPVVIFTKSDSVVGGTNHQLGTVNELRQIHPNDHNADAVGQSNDLRLAVVEAVVAQGRRTRTGTEADAQQQAK
jgi:hypothetical protein